MCQGPGTYRGFGSTDLTAAGRNCNNRAVLQIGSTTYCVLLWASRINVLWRGLVSFTVLRTPPFVCWAFPSPFTFACRLLSAPRATSRVLYSNSIGPCTLLKLLFVVYGSRHLGSRNHKLKDPQHCGADSLAESQNITMAFNFLNHSKLVVESCPSNSGPDPLPLHSSPKLNTRTLSVSSLDYS